MRVPWFSLRGCRKLLQGTGQMFSHTPLCDPTNFLIIFAGQPLWCVREHLAWHLYVSAIYSLAVSPESVRTVRHTLCLSLGAISWSLLLTNLIHDTWTLHLVLIKSITSKLGSAGHKSWNNSLIFKPSISEDETVEVPRVLLLKG